VEAEAPPVTITNLDDHRPAEPAATSAVRPAQPSERSRAGRVPPHDLDAERALLGAMLLNPEALAAANDAGVAAEDFYKPAHAHIYDAVRRIAAGGARADYVTVANRLAADNLLDTIGGPSALLELGHNTPSSSHSAARGYATIVADLGTVRRMIGAAGEIAELGYSWPADIAAAVDQAEQHIYHLRRSAQTLDVAPVGDSLEEWLDHIEERSLRGGEPLISTGWRSLDDTLDGLHPTRLLVVGARPGMGKSQWGLALARNVAHGGHPVLFVSAEMSRPEILTRLVACEARIDSKKLAKGAIADSDWARVSNAMASVQALPLSVVYAPAAGLLSVRHAARRAASKFGALALVVVDYLQLLAPPAKGENRQVDVSEIARGLKHLAGDLPAAVVALSQLSRALEVRGDKRPTLPDLRESGEIEQAADQVAFLYRDDYYHPDSSERGTAEVLVEKNRHGERDTIRMAVDLRYGRWSDVAREAGQ
jgi:replicative DNA helicase